MTSYPDSASLIAAIREGRFDAIKQRLQAVAERKEVNISFRSDYGTFKKALLSLKVGDYLVWDQAEYSRHSWHNIAFKNGIKIATKRHATISATVILRIA